MLEPKPVSAPLPRLVSFARALTIGRRRLAVLATIFGFPGLYAWDAVTGSKVPFALDLIVSLALLSMTLMGGFLLWLWVRNRVDLRASLDERERGVRDQVYVRSYQVLGVVWTGIIVLVSAFALLGQPITLSFEALTGVIILNAVYFPMIPTLVAAWTEGDPLPEDA